MSNSPGSITPRNKSRIDIVVELGTRYNILRDRDAPSSEYETLARDYESHDMVVPSFVRVAAGIVTRPHACGTTRPEYQARIIALLEHEPASIRQIARALGRSQTQTAELVAKMAGEGMIERIGCGLAQWRLTTKEMA